MLKVVIITPTLILIEKMENGERRVEEEWSKVRRVEDLWRRPVEHPHWYSTNSFTTFFLLKFFRESW